MDNLDLIYKKTMLNAMQALIESQHAILKKTLGDCIDGDGCGGIYEEEEGLNNASDSIQLTIMHLNNR